MRKGENNDVVRGTLALALEGLDATTRLVLALLHVEHLTVEETAEALGLECAEVEHTAERARIALLGRVEDRSPRTGSARHAA